MATDATRHIPGLPDEADAATEAWAIAHELFHRRRGDFLRIAGEAGLSPPALLSLRWLEPERPVPMRELARYLVCDNSNVTGIVDRLEAAGLVERRSDERDRRVRMVVVTEAGIAMRERVTAAMYEPPPGIAALPADEQERLRDLLRRALELEQR